MSLRDIIDGVRAQRQNMSNQGDRTRLDFDADRDSVLVVYLFRGLGDAVLFAPLLSAFKKKNPNTRLGIIVSEFAAKVLSLFDLNIEMFEVSEEWFSAVNGSTKLQLRTKNRIEEILKRDIRSANFSIGIELTGDASVPASDWLNDLDLRYTLGWASTASEKNNPGPHLNHSFTRRITDIRYLADRHWSLALCRAFSVLGVESPDASLQVPKNDRAVAWADKQWKDGIRVLVFPGSRDKNKQWNPGQFAAVINKIHTNYDVSVIVCGAPSEVTLVEQVRRQMLPSTVRYTGRNLHRLAALIGGAALVITNDSGPMHLSYLSGVPTVAVYKYMSSAVWGPLRPHRDVLTIETRNYSDLQINELIWRFLRRLLRRAYFSKFRRKTD